MTTATTRWWPQRSVMRTPSGPRSTLSSKESVKWEDGKEYPLIKVEVSSASHPFYTGQNKIMDTSGRVDKFRRRYTK